MLEPQKKQNFNNEVANQTLNTLLNIFKKRRSTRQFSDDNIDINIITKAIEIAATAPSGANKQPWSFGIIKDKNLKEDIRLWAEAEEFRFYEKDSWTKWKQDLKPLHTTSQKTFLTDAVYLIPIFYKNYELDNHGNKSQNYYVKESLGIATGFLLSALHLSGLSTLTYTPTNKQFLSKILERDNNENTFMIIAVGLPHDQAVVPTITKKNLDEILNIYE